MDFDSSSLDYYHNDLQSCPPLSQKEESDIVALMKTGSADVRKKMRDKLITCNLRFGLKVAATFKGKGLSMEDLIMEANVGLCEAADHYDPEKNVRFQTYAVWWIRQRIYKALASAYQIRIPGSVFPALKAYTDMGEEARKLTDEELAVKLGCTVETANAIRNVASAMMVLSLEQQITDGCDMTIGDTIKAEDQDIDQQIYIQSMTDVIREAIEDLSPKEADILRRRNGIDGPVETLEDIGEDYGRTKERIRQIERKAIKRLKLRLKKLEKDYQEENS